MQNLWDDEAVKNFADDPLQLRVYASRLLGREPSLVLHGGGNTSVKMTVRNLFGDEQEILYVKGSGWDLATIEAAGFAPVRLDVLLRLATVENLSDTVVVREQRAAMIDPNAPNPSVEAILHAVIPFRYVDHSHANALVTLTNTPHGVDIMRELYGERVFIVPYVMPGFTLAQRVYEMTQGIDWAAYDGIVLLNHGLFTFDDDQRASYSRHIELVSAAEDYLASRAAFAAVAVSSHEPEIDLLMLSRLRQAVSDAAGKPIIAQLDVHPEAVGFTELPDLASIATRGPLTPDHVLRTKRIPMILGDDPVADVASYAADYAAYFERITDGSLTMLDAAPRWVLWPGCGSVALGETVKASSIVADIAQHTMRAIQWAEAASAWQALPEKAIFDVEYWELEQAKLQKQSNVPVFQGKIALVTGAASGIGRACAEALSENGAAVVALDIDPEVEMLFNTSAARGMAVDLTDDSALRDAVSMAVRVFGGLDILVSNAGIFPASQTIEAMNADDWDRSIAINLTSHQRVLQACIPFLKNGVDPAVVVIGSKNFPAPGPGASAYSVSKAGLTQLARVAALELGGDGIRVNVIHPDAVFDTGIWTEEVLEKRATHYNLSVHQYKTKNLLGAEITSRDVAALACAMAGPAFSKTTGAQVPIDGGNDRVI